MTRQKVTQIGQYAVMLRSYKNPQDMFLIFYDVDLICEIQSNDVTKSQFKQAFNRWGSLNARKRNVDQWTIEEHLSKIGELNDDV